MTGAGGSRATDLDGAGGAVPGVKPARAGQRIVLARDKTSCFFFLRVVRKPGVGQAAVGLGCMFQYLYVGIALLYVLWLISGVCSVCVRVRIFSVFNCVALTGKSKQRAI